VLSNTSTFRIRYGETDQMGVVYHGNYAAFFELGRTEWLRSLGVSYKDMEAKGIMLPVISLTCSFKKSAYYDEVLNIQTTLTQAPTARIEFLYEITNEKKEVITTGNSVLVFIDMKTKKPMRCPEWLLQKLA